MGGGRWTVWDQCMLDGQGRWLEDCILYKTRGHKKVTVRSRNCHITVKYLSKVVQPIVWLKITILRYLFLSVAIIYISFYFFLLIKQLIKRIRVELANYFSLKSNTKSQLSYLRNLTNKRSRKSTYNVTNTDL